MLRDLLAFYLEGLLLATVVVVSLLGLWGVYRAIKKYDKTSQERQAFLYDMLLIAIMTIPILSFAFTGLVLMLQA